jgi:hypothetical protein
MTHDQTPPTTALTSLERAMAKCQDEAAEALAAAKGPPQLDEHGYDHVGGTGGQFGRAMALMKMTAKLGSVMAKLSSHRSQTHVVHRTEIRAAQPQAAPVTLLAPVGDPEPPLRYFDDKGKRRPLTVEEAARYNAWSDRQAERDRRAFQEREAKEGAPTPNSSGSNGENGPRVRY